MSECYIILAIIAILAFIGLFYSSIKGRKPSSIVSISQVRTKFQAERDWINVLAVFILAAWAHLAGDLPTPSSVWGGIAMFWPSVDYVGGSGKIWWWNNYDIFLLIVGSIIINLTIPAIFKKVREKARLFTTTILSITLILILIQVNTRQFDYAYKGNTSKYAEMELNSKKEQQRILGKHLYRYMERFDGMLKFYF